MILGDHGNDDDISSPDFFDGICFEILFGGRNSRTTPTPFAKAFCQKDSSL